MFLFLLEQDQNIHSSCKEFLYVWKGGEFINWLFLKACCQAHAHNGMQTYYPPGSRGKRRSLEIAAGTACWSKMMATQFGFFTEQHDILYHPDQDLTQSTYLNWVLRGISMRLWHFVHLGTECTTFSLAASGHYRDAANLFGFAGLKGKKLAKVKSANIQARHSWIILKACKAARIPCSLENPAGSWLFKLPDGTKMLEDGWHHILLHYCAYGRPYMKPTIIMTWVDWLDSLEAPCAHGGKRHRSTLRGAVWSRSLKRWVARTKTANEYPPRLLDKWCGAIASRVKLDLQGLRVPVCK